MVKRFPDLIDWMDEMNMGELHSLHKEVSPSSSFSSFVREEYEAQKQMWHDDMNTRCLLNYEINPEGNDMIFETAKYLLVEIVNNSIKSGNVKKILIEGDLTPDYRCDVDVINDFFFKIIPAMDNMLKDMHRW